MPREPVSRAKVASEAAGGAKCVPITKTRARRRVWTGGSRSARRLFSGRVLEGSNNAISKLPQIIPPMIAARNVALRLWQSAEPFKPFV